MSSDLSRSSLKSIAATACCALLVSCASGPESGTLRIHDDYVPTGALRLGEVVYLAPRSEVIGVPRLYNAILASGVRDEDIRDGSVVFTRVECCNGPNEKATARLVYVPSSVKVQTGDIVEIRTGHPPQNDSGALHTVNQVRQKHGDGGACRWIPPDERMWARVLYCDWMPSEGWVRQNSVITAKHWYRPSP